MLALAPTTSTLSSTALWLLGQSCPLGSALVSPW